MSGNMNVLLHVRNMRKMRGERRRRISIEIPEFFVSRGEFVAVTGPNGCGKSTLLDMLGLILGPDTVEVFRLGTMPPVDLNRLTPAGKNRVRRRYVAYALQQCGLLDFLTVRQNLRFAAQLKGRPVTEIEKIARNFGLGDVMNKKPGKTSGGQRQKANIACALVQRPLLILADEPTSALDPPSATKLMETFRSLTREAGIALIMVTHAHALVRDQADRVYDFFFREESDVLLRSILREKSVGTMSSTSMSNTPLDTGGAL